MMKKIISIAAALTFICSSLNVCYADTPTVTTQSGEKPAYGEILLANYDGDGTVEWQRVVSGKAETLSEGKSYTVTEADAGAKLRYVVKTDGEIALTSEQVSIATWIDKRTTNKSYAGNGTKNADYSFTVDGKKFTVAKIFNNPDSKYFVFADDIYGKRPFDNRIMNPESGLQKWLDGDFLAYGNGEGKKLPEGFKNHINFNHVWLTENAPSSGLDNPYTFKAGVTVPSVSELMLYSNVGKKDIGGNYYTRTPVNHINKSAPNWLLIINTASSTDTQFRVAHWEVNSAPDVRPVFYLKDGFFANVAVDLKSAGKEIIKEIKRYDSETLAKIYNVSDLMTYLGMAPPPGFIFVNDVKVKTRSAEAVAYGETLVPDFVYSQDNAYALADWRVEWYKEVNGEEVKVGEEKEYIVKEGDGGYNLFYKLFVTDEEGNSSDAKSEKVSVPALKNDAFAPNVGIKIGAYADAKYKFTFDGQEFTLIDTFNNDKSTFFVMSNQLFGTKSIYTNYMDEKDSANLAYWLNNEFVKNGNGDKKLPQGIIDHIDFEHEWLGEPAPNAVNEIKAYTFKAGIAIPSMNELVRYSDVIGWNDVKMAEGARYFSRTAANYKSSDGETLYILTIGMANSTGISTNVWSIPSGTNIRPEFYLDKDFFKENVIDLDTAGSYVIDAMKKMYTIEELSGYDEKKLKELGFNSNFEIEAKFKSGTTQLDDLNGVIALSAEVTLTSYCDKGTEGLLVLALYDEDGMTYKMAFEKISTKANEANTKTLTVSELSGVTSEYSAKVMFWNDIFSINAITDWAEF